MLGCFFLSDLSRNITSVQALQELVLQVRAQELVPQVRALVPVPRVLALLLLSSRALPVSFLVRTDSQLVQA